MAGDGAVGASTAGLGSMFRPVAFVMIELLLLLGDKLKEVIPHAERTRTFAHCVREVSWIRDNGRIDAMDFCSMHFEKETKPLMREKVAEVTRKIFVLQLLISQHAPCLGLPVSKN
jgi:hypothetical protein